MLPTTRAPRRAPEAPVTPESMMEKHYTIVELAEKWGFSYQFVLERFQDEPGVVRPPKTQKRQPGESGRPKRSYGVIRVPESVALRVYSRMVVGS